MCCFSREVLSVSGTSLFARLEPDGRQYVVYAMSVHSKEEVAMILPVPVAEGQGEAAMKFVDLSGYPEMFREMNRGFPVPRSRSAADPFAGVTAAPKPLKVEQVGAFDASYVPTVADFSRLDARFRLPDGTWEKLPGYAGFGFAVFKLREGRRDYHPMAFSFPSAVPDRLFFPTLHIHDGEVHKKAHFDHTLYCQGQGLKAGEWQESEQLAIQFMKPGKTQGIVLPGQHIHRRRLIGQLANTDWLVKAQAVG